MENQLIPNHPAEISEQQYYTLLDQYNNLKETSKNQRKIFWLTIISLIIFFTLSFLLFYQWMGNTYYKQLLINNNNNIDKMIEFLNTLRNPI
jgi:flagellar basal body-associated protein FliL